MWFVPWVLGALLISAAALIPLLRGAARRREVAGVRARAQSLYERLGFAVETVPRDTEDAEAASALRQAAERWNTTGALLADADSVPQCEVAERTAREGLELIALACGRLAVDVPEPS